MKLKTGKKTGLKYFSIDDIRSWGPCYDPGKHLASNWRGTAVDVLKMDAVPHEDRLWVVLRPELVSDRVMRLFAVWCARQVQHLMTDPRSLRALDVAEAFTEGRATCEELAAARAAAWDAADAAGAAWDAADAAQAAARAAWAAAWPAAADAAWGAARDAARAAAWAVAAADAAGAARAAQQAQLAKLIEMIEAEGLERVRMKGGG